MVGIDLIQSPIDTIKVLIGLEPVAWFL